MSHFEQLDPDQRIVLRMAVRRRRSYDAMAEALGSTPDELRRRARAAADALVPERPPGLTDEDRGRITDYLLGQQEGPSRAASVRRLGPEGPARTWGLLLEERLSGLGEPVATVPAAAAAAAPAAAGTTPTRTARAAGARRPRAGSAREAGARRTRSAGPATRRWPLARVGGAVRRALGRRRHRVLAGAGLAVVVVLVGLAVTGVLGGGDDGDGGGNLPEATENQALAVQFTAAMPQSIPFRAPSGASAEFASVTGVATPTVSTEDPAVPVLSLAIDGLPEATASRRYFVWADKDGQQPALLGELSAVSGAQLPFQGVDVATGQAVVIDPTVYSRVRVTRESTASPTGPGPTVLVGTITPRTA